MSSELLTAQPPRTRAGGPRPHPRKIRTLHKWAGIAVGVVLGMWLVSGILMVSGGAPTGAQPSAQPDYARLAISPADAARAAVAARGNEATVNDVGMVNIGGVIAYRVATSKGPVLVDAATGTVFDITPAYAAKLVVGAYPNAGPIRRTTLITSQGASYIGPVPVYRVDTRAGTYVVSPGDGRITPISRLTVVRRAFISLHDFSLIAPFAGRQNATRLLLLFAFTTIALVLTGYYLGIRALRK